jgi:hypothetical protein
LVLKNAVAAFETAEFTALPAADIAPLTFTYLISKKPQPTEEQAHVVSHPTASM